jgi:fructose-1,6-bisphosphatase I
MIDILNHIIAAGKFISGKIRRAVIECLCSTTSNINYHGEEVKTLDMLSNEEFISNLKKSKYVVAMVSEEESCVIKTNNENGKYYVTFDPLDGSSNIDANINIGSIFGIYLNDNENYLRPGKEMICAGYILYGSATMLVLSMKNCVNGFCLDDNMGTFILSHPNIKIPTNTNIYSINEGNCETWKKSIVDLIIYIKSTDETNNKKPYSLRYIGSMVADVHRTLLYGGLFMYPAGNNATSGKLRYLYEVAPMAHIIKNAGGKSLIDGNIDALDYVPSSIHQRVPIFMGSVQNMELVSTFLKEI